MTPPDSSTRDRLLETALALFASQGYSATSVADIQQACGLSPASGALYKHFPSKKALLQEATRRHVQQMDAVRDESDRTHASDAKSALRQGAERIWAIIDDNSRLLRVMLREPEALDDMINDLWSAVAPTAYQRTARALGAAKDPGISQVEDPEATSTVLVAALAYLPILELLIQRTPGKLDADRFREAWLRLPAGAVTGVPPTSPLDARSGGRTAGKQSVSRNVWRTSIGHGEVVLAAAEITPWPTHPRRELRRAGSTGSRARLPVRSRRCPDRHRECPHQGMASHVRCVPAATSRAARRAVRPVRSGRRLPEIRRWQET